MNWSEPVPFLYGFVAERKVDGKVISRIVQTNGRVVLFQYSYPDGKMKLSNTELVSGFQHGINRAA